MQAGIDSTNKMLAERGLDIMPDLETYRELFDFPVKEYYRSLGFDFEKEPYDLLAHIWVEGYLKNSKASRLCEGARETLEEVRRLGIGQIVLSASEQTMLTRQLSELGIIGYFDEIIGLDNIHAGSKVSLAECWRQDNPDARAVMVGDTLHDADTAMALGADCLLYSGGHQSKRKLLSRGVRVIDDLSEIVSIMKGG